MKSIALFRFAAAFILTLITCAAAAEQPLQSLSIPGVRPDCGRLPSSGPFPTCAIELTCTDKPVQLGYSDGVCFRATCPGIWGIMHRRADQASFRRRNFTYRHYAFKGIWQVKDQGAIESGPEPCRELFLVLPEDLIEFKLQDPDCNTAIEIKSLGYIKNGTVEELKKWLAYNTYLEKPVFRRPDSQARSDSSVGPWYRGSAYGYANVITAPFSYISRFLGLTWFPGVGQE